MKFGVVVFPGTWSDVDCFDVLNDVFHQPVEYVWHKDTDLSPYDCIILPGGFSYGDYLRPGAIARFSPAMQGGDRLRREWWTCYRHLQWLPDSLRGRAVARHTAAERPPAISMPMDDPTRGERKYSIHRSSDSRPDAAGPNFSWRREFFAEEAVIKRLEANNRVVFRYCTPDGGITKEANPNGSLNNIAGILNERGNVLGMMPHPERCCDALLGGEDGKFVFQSMIDALSARILSGVLA